MRAITIWPEWVWAITRLGKNIENRTRTTHVLKPGDLLAIHAGAYLGGTQKYVRPAVAFYPVQVMAARSGWRLGVEAADNSIIAYNTRTPSTVQDRIHTLPYGSVAAVATFGGVLEPGSVARGEELWPWWASDQYGYILEKVQRLPTPVYCRGQQGLWTLPDNVLHEVVEQLSRT